LTHPQSAAAAFFRGYLKRKRRSRAVLRERLFISVHFVECIDAFFIWHRSPAGLCNVGWSIFERLQFQNPGGEAGEDLSGFCLADRLS